ncbi:MAG: hypothetical protein ABIH23_13210 [bacterium]
MWSPKELKESLGAVSGEFEAEIVDAYDGHSQSSGSEMTTVVFDTKSEPEQKVFDHFVKDNTVAGRRMLSLLEAVGLAEQESVESKDLIGKTLRVRIDVEEYMGLPQPKVKRFMPVVE